VVWAVGGSDDDRAWLQSRLADADEAPEVRAAALYRLADEGALSMPAVLELYRSTEDADVREETLWVLAQMDSDGDAGPRIEALIEIVRTEEDPDLRQAALHALTEIDDPRVAAFLEAFLRGGGGV
jgi:HEAT repeat protein